MSEPRPRSPEYTLGYSGGYTRYPPIPTTKIDLRGALLRLSYNEIIEGLQSWDWVTLPDDVIEQLRDHPRWWNLEIPGDRQVPLLGSILQNHGSSETKGDRLPGVSFETSNGQTLVTKKNGRSFHIFIQKRDKKYKPVVTIAWGGSDEELTSAS